MNQAIATTFSEDQKLQLALALAVPTSGQIVAAPRIEDMAAQMGVSTGDLALLLNDPKFLNLVRGFTKAQANLTLHSQGVAKLVEIVGTGDNKEALTAIKILGQITGDLRNNITHEVKVTF